MEKLDNNMPLGLAGIMRVKNEAGFIEQCVTSCIDALDELIIVYNDCTDDTADILVDLRAVYPGKIKVYEYPYKVYGANLSKQEYEYVKSLPADSPHLLCNYYNFALSKVSYSHAIKIDADQLYFSEILAYWRKVIVNRTCVRGSVVGAIFHYAFTAYRFVSLKLGRRIPFLPAWLIRTMKPYYEQYAISQLAKGKAAISLSGLNVFWDQEWYVLMGKEGENGFNLIPPFNGEGDHLVFPMSPGLHYEPFEMPYYSKLVGCRYSIIEQFVHPYKVFYLGFSWFHLNTMRPGVVERVLMVKNTNPECFVALGSFLSQSFTSIERRSDFRMFSLFQRLLFSYIFPAYQNVLRNNVHLLK